MPKLLWLYLAGLFYSLNFVSASSFDPQSNLESKKYLEPRVLNTLGYVYPNKPVDGKNDGSWIYKINTTHHQKKDLDSIHVNYFDPKGKMVSEQELKAINGEVKEYSQNILSSNYHATVKVLEDKVVFEINDDGDIKSKTISKPPQLVMGPFLNVWIQSHLVELVSGNKVEFRMAVVHRMDIFGMQLERIEGDEEEVRKKKWIKLKMKPSSIVFAALSPEIVFFVDAHTGKVMRYEGPVGSQISDRSIEGTIRYDHP